MFSGIQNAAGQSTHSLYARRGNRSIVAAALIAATLLLGACGGGGDDGGASANIGIGVTVGGQPRSNFPVAQGGSFDLAVRADDSVILEAPEPVVWTLVVGGNAFRTGVGVEDRGVFIIARTLDSFTVAVDTAADFVVSSPVLITLVANSTFDSAQVAAVNILITN